MCIFSTTAPNNKEGRIVYSHRSVPKFSFFLSFQRLSSKNDITWTARRMKLFAMAWAMNQAFIIYIFVPICFKWFSNHHTSGIKMTSILCHNGRNYFQNSCIHGLVYTSFSQTQKYLNSLGFYNCIQNYYGQSEGVLLSTFLDVAKVLQEEQGTPRRKHYHAYPWSTLSSAA